MKNHKELIIVISFLIAIVAVKMTMAAYTAYTPITAVDITSHSDDDPVLVGEDYTVTCTTSTDTDCEVGVSTVSDPVTHTWSGSGTFDPGTGTSVSWAAPYTTGDTTLTVTASDSPLYDETDKTDSVTLDVQGPLDFYSLDPDKISGGYLHTIVLMDNGDVWGCGHTAGKRLGTEQDDPSDPWRLAIVRMEDGGMSTESGYLEDIVDVAAGKKHTLAVDENGYVWHWGTNFYGQRGNGCTSLEANDPVMNGLGNIVEVAVGSYSNNSKALDSNGNVWCWGSLALGAKIPRFPIL